MKRKDYQVLEDAIKGLSCLKERQRFVEVLSPHLKKNNSNFAPGSFAKACNAPFALVNPGPDGGKE